MTYKFQGFDFTNSEIEQIMDLLRPSNWTSIGLIDRRNKLTDNVVRWGVAFGLLVWECQTHKDCGGHKAIDTSWQGCPPVYGCDWRPEKGGECEWRLRYRWSAWESDPPKKFMPWLDLPAEALWRIVKTFLYYEGSDKPRGYSINKQRGWQWLNIWPEGGTTDEVSASAARLERTEVMLRLEREGYIRFRTCGDIWQINVLV